MRGEAEDDAYNALVLAAGLTWREVALVRSLSRYLRQVGVPFSQGYMATTLVKHAEVAERIAMLFAARFDPRLAASPDERADRQAAIFADIEAAARKVDSLDEDRILRHFANVVQAAVRTNFYQEDAGQPQPVIAVKFDSRKVTAMPLPRPRLRNLHLLAAARSACTCASGRWRAAASGGRTGRRIFAPRCWASSKRNR